MAQFDARLETSMPFAPMVGATYCSHLSWIHKTLVSFNALYVHFIFCAITCGFCVCDTMTIEMKVNCHPGLEWTARIIFESSFSFRHLRSRPFAVLHAGFWTNDVFLQLAVPAQQTADGRVTLVYNGTRVVLADYPLQVKNTTAFPFRTVAVTLYLTALYNIPSNISHIISLESSYWLLMIGEVNSIEKNLL